MRYGFTDDEWRTIPILCPAVPKIVLLPRTASAGAFLLCGRDARQLAQPVEATQGVIASYPQGPSLRVVADPNAEESLRRVASIHGANFTRVATRLEDAVLAFSRRRSAE
jgi:hypothetical protein